MKRKFMFIKENVPRDIGSIPNNVQTLVTLVGETITKENTRGGGKIKFMIVIVLEIGPTFTTKKFKKRIIKWL